MKKFDDFISRNFDGYSAHTLFQELSRTMPKEIVSKWIYENVYHVFIGKYVSSDLDICHRIAIIVFNNPDLKGEINSFLLELDETKYRVQYGYKVQNEDYLKNNALDMYLKNVIDLKDFKFIMLL